MSTPVRAIETTGVIDEKSQLRLDAPLPVVGPSRVRVIVLIPEGEHNEISESEWLYAAAKNPAFDFLKEPEEDIYTLADGRPFDDKGNYLRACRQKSMRNCVTCSGCDLRLAGCLKDQTTQAYTPLLREQPCCTR